MKSKDEIIKTLKKANNLSEVILSMPQPNKEIRNLIRSIGADFIIETDRYYLPISMIAPYENFVIVNKRDGAATFATHDENCFGYKELKGDTIRHYYSCKEFLELRAS